MGEGEPVIFEERRRYYLLGKYTRAVFLLSVFFIILGWLILAALDALLGTGLNVYEDNAEFELFLGVGLLILVEGGLLAASRFFLRRQRVAVGRGQLRLAYRVKGNRRDNLSDIEAVRVEDIATIVVLESPVLDHVLSGRWGFWVMRLHLKDGRTVAVYRNEAKGCKHSEFVPALKEFLLEAERSGTIVRREKQTLGGMKLKEGLDVEWPFD